MRPSGKNMPSTSYIDQPLKGDTYMLMRFRTLSAVDSFFFGAARGLGFGLAFDVSTKKGDDYINLKK